MHLNNKTNFHSPGAIGTSINIKPKKHLSIRLMKCDPCQSSAPFPYDSRKCVYCFQRLPGNITRFVFRESDLWPLLNVRPNPPLGWAIWLDLCAAHGKCYRRLGLRESKTSPIPSYWKWTTLSYGLDFSFSLTKVCFFELRLTRTTIMFSIWFT